jgi:hypothetical protein
VPSVEAVWLALVELELADVEAVLLAAFAGCWSCASSSSSTLANSVEPVLPVADVEAELLALDALELSVLALDVLSLDRPDRKLMFSSWKKAGGLTAPDWPPTTELLPSVLLLLDELLVEAEVCPAWSRCNCSCCHCWKTSDCETLLTLMKEPSLGKGVVNLLPGAIRRPSGSSRLIRCL